MPDSRNTAELLSLIEQHWGYRTLRPMQERAMQAVLERRDSLVVMPTGGGKSLCFQAPALTRPTEVTVVISPLIALMKDQVDSLRAVGINARHVDSTLTETQRVETFHDLKAGRCRLLFTSPERLAMANFQTFLEQLGVRTFAIDEAHCISHWGHDFRPEYRQLSTLRQRFPNATVHGYTATATPQVREDIARQLSLHNPEILIGDFDRPNLNYSVIPRTHVLPQVLEVLDRHKGEAGIIYCIRRKDVDQLAEQLQSQGINVVAYHAGLGIEERKAAQEAFKAERCDIVVATVAFGMGIDRSNVRFVLHTGMPKSIEHYQQEAGRAGRDGLEAECILLAGGQDFMTWKFILEKSAEENEVDADFLPNAMGHLKEIMDYTRSSTCRHKALVEHFGQKFTKAGCKACDLCLGEREFEAESQDIARKIISCVARTGERFGIGHIVSVLRGEHSEKIERYGHDNLSTFGLLDSIPAAGIRDWLHQLIEQELLTQQGGEYPTLQLNEQSWEVLRNQRQVELLKRGAKSKARVSRSASETESWEGVDKPLFEALRVWRRQMAELKSMPAYVIFGDATLRELARVRPASLPGLRKIYGIGDTKLEEYGRALLYEIVEFCKANGLSMDVSGPQRLAAPPVQQAETSDLTESYFNYFRKRASIDDVVKATGRATSTIAKYLEQFILQEKLESIEPWVSDEIRHKVLEAARTDETGRLKPVFEALGGTVTYDTIRLTLTHAKMMAEK